MELTQKFMVLDFNRVYIEYNDVCYKEPDS